MGASKADTRVRKLAQILFNLFTEFCLVIPRSHRHSSDLKEGEFLTLRLLHHHQMLIVGDIQRHLGISPVRMSRIIRSLESRERPLIACCFHPDDRRKINVALTLAGDDAFQEYQSSRVGVISELIGKLSEEDLDDLQRLLAKLHECQQ